MRNLTEHVIRRPFPLLTQTERYLGAPSDAPVTHLNFFPHTGPVGSPPSPSEPPSWEEKSIDISVIYCPVPRDPFPPENELPVTDQGTV